MSLEHPQNNRDELKKPQQREDTAALQQNIGENLAVPENAGLTGEESKEVLRSLFTLTPKQQIMMEQLNILRIALESCKGDLIQERSTIATLTKYLETDKTGDARIAKIDQALKALDDASAEIIAKPDTNVSAVIPDTVKDLFQEIGLDVPNVLHDPYFDEIFSYGRIHPANSPEDLAGQHLALIKYLRNRNDIDAVRALIEDKYFRAHFEFMREKIPWNEKGELRDKIAVKVEKMANDPEVIKAWEKQGFTDPKKINEIKSVLIEREYQRGLNLMIAELHDGRPFNLQGVRASLWEAYRDMLGAGSMNISDETGNQLIKTALITAPIIVASSGAGLVAAGLTRAALGLAGISSGIVRGAVGMGAFAGGFSTAEYALEKGEFLFSQDDRIVIEKITRAAAYGGIMKLGATAGKLAGDFLSNNLSALVPSIAVRNFIGNVLAKGSVQSALLMTLSAVEHYQTMGSFYKWDTLDQLMNVLILSGAMSITGRVVKFGSRALNIDEVMAKAKAREGAKLQEKKELRGGAERFLETFDRAKLPEIAVKNPRLFAEIIRTAKELPLQLNELLDIFKMQKEANVKLSPHIQLQAFYKCPEIAKFATVENLGKLTEMLKDSLKMPSTEILAKLRKLPGGVAGFLVLMSGCDATTAATQALESVKSIIGGVLWGGVGVVDLFFLKKIAAKTLLRGFSAVPYLYYRFGRPITIRGRTLNFGRASQVIENFRTLDPARAALLNDVDGRITEFKHKLFHGMLDLTVVEIRRLGGFIDRVEAQLTILRSPASTQPQLQGAATILINELNQAMTPNSFLGSINKMAIVVDVLFIIFGLSKILGDSDFDNAIDEMNQEKEDAKDDFDIDDVPAPLFTDPYESGEIEKGWIEGTWDKITGSDTDQDSSQSESSKPRKFKVNWK
ncbi:hypothetical protein HYW82_00625 [Candidatus Peregrinibacteria bacterium]|nr:hypothetical protein [Candidatus Peregrinibacteria bacterium]